MAASCVEDCQRTENKNEMLQCVLCAEFFHTECIGVTKKAKALPFSCLSCRQIPAKVEKMFELIKELDIDKLSNVVTTLLDKNTLLVNEVTSLKQEISKVRKENCEILNKLTVLSEDNKRLIETVTSISTSVQRLNWTNFRKQDNNHNRPHSGDEDKTDKELVLSDSMLRLIDSGKLEDTKIVASPGADIDKILSELDKPDYNDVKYERIVIMLGTNEVQKISDEEADLHESIQKYGELIDKAKSIAKEITVSSVCPRLDKHGDKVAAFNTGLEGICEERNCDFIDQTKTFTLADNSVNDGYLAAGIGPHLSKAGLNKVARNLHLRIKPGITDVMRSYPNRNQANQRSMNQRFSNATKREVPGVRYNRNGCVLCNEPGHNAADCFHNNRGPVICRTCKETGHKAKHHYRSNH